jgi:nitrile hydratase subunit alpha
MPHEDHDHDRAQDIHEHLLSHLPEEPALRVKALETVLIRKGLISAQTIAAWIDAYSNHIGPRRGAELVARAWVDPAFKARLLQDADTVLREAGYEGVEAGHVKVVENTPTVHNVIVCTLCSCYPWALLGIPPDWYKSAAYRSRVVRAPRAVLAEFGLVLDEGIQLRVWDSSAELRYLVLPERPQGTEALPEAALAGLVTRNAMVGTARVAAPVRG